MRPGGRVDDRVRPVDELELLVAPRRLLRAFMLAVAHGHRLARQRLCASSASKRIWMFSQSPSWVLFQSLKT